jgi:hypothetical protein
MSLSFTCSGHVCRRPLRSYVAAGSCHHIAGAMWLGALRARVLAIQDCGLDEEGIVLLKAAMSALVALAPGPLFDAELRARTDAFETVVLGVASHCRVLIVKFFV